jgi:uncharacterized protein YjeT (DUF2065 family)
MLAVVLGLVHLLAPRGMAEMYSAIAKMDRSYSRDEPPPRTGFMRAAGATLIVVGLYIIIATVSP